MKAILSISAPFPPPSFLYEATTRAHNVVQEVKEFAKECNNLEQGTMLAVSYLTIIGRETSKVFFCQFYFKMLCIASDHNYLIQNKRNENFDTWN